MFVDVEMVTSTEDANTIRNLWESRAKRGLLPVLEEMNELLARGVISESAFQQLLAGTSPAEDEGERSGSPARPAPSNRATAGARIPFFDLDF